MPKSAAQSAPSPAPAPVMIDVSSPEFQAAVRAAVASASANMAGASPQAISGVVAQTSIDTTKPGLDDLTVRFHRFCTFQGCGYQRDQEAGFPRAAAEALAATGAATIVYDPRRHR